MPTRMIRAAAILAVALSAGCAYRGSATDFDPGELRHGAGWLAATPVPVVLQKDREDCGAAVLAMALAAWRVPASLEEIKQAWPPAPGVGIKAAALRDFACRKDLRAFVIEGRIADLEYELSKSRPVIAGLVKPYATRGLTHYECVVALHPERRVIVTLDPVHGWRQNSYEGFEAEWAPAGHLLLVIFRPAGGRVREPVWPTLSPDRSPCRTSSGRGPASLSAFPSWPRCPSGPVRAAASAPGRRPPGST